MRKLPKPLYYTTEEGGYWQKFEAGTVPGRLIYALVLDSGDVFDSALGGWRGRFDPVKMRHIAKLFEPQERTMAQDPNEFAIDLQTLISEAQAAGIPDNDLAAILASALSGLGGDEDDDDPADAE